MWSNKSKGRTIAERCMKAVAVLRTSFLRDSLCPLAIERFDPQQSCTKLEAFDRVPQLSQLFCAKFVCTDLKKQGKRCPHCQLSRCAHHVHLNNVCRLDGRFCDFRFTRLLLCSKPTKPVWRRLCNGSKPASSHWWLRVEIHLQVACPGHPHRLTLLYHPRAGTAWQ